MRIVTYGLLLLISLLWFHPDVKAQRQQTRSSTTSHIQPLTQISGVYRIDVANSDRLYSVVAGASSSLPFSDQQRFFIDLTIRLTPPDQLAIERRGDVVQIASSRAPRTSFRADGREQVERAANGTDSRRHADD